LPSTRTGSIRMPGKFLSVSAIGSSCLQLLDVVYANADSCFQYLQSDRLAFNVKAQLIRQ
jgi:hypothetical protein